MDNSGSISLLSVNCGLPRQVPWHGGNVTTAIYKEPVKGRVAVRTLNLDGDRQADLSVHGGASKAVYCYPAAHYQYWRAELPGRELPSGSFGENFTVDGLVEDSVHIGDRFTVGSAQVILRLYVTKHYSREDIADVRRALMAPALPDSWKEYFRERLARVGA